MKVRLAKKIACKPTHYWMLHRYIKYDARITKAIKIYRRKARKLALKAEEPLQCSTCDWCNYVAEMNDIWRDCTYKGECHYNNKWKPIKKGGQE